MCLVYYQVSPQGDFKMKGKIQKQNDQFFRATTLFPELILADVIWLPLVSISLFAKCIKMYFQLNHRTNFGLNYSKKARSRGTMCYKCPPFPTAIITFYLACNVLLLIVTYARAFYMVGPVDIHVQSIEKCFNYAENDLILDYSINPEDNSLTGNMSLYTDIDENVKINFREKPPLPHEPLIIYINQRNFCKITNGFFSTRPYPLMDEAEEKPICPVSKGKYYIQGLKLDFSLMQLPYEMLGTKMYQAELVKNGNLLVCLDLQIHINYKNLSEYLQYTNVYKDVQDQY
ncbi:unnamed protein product [Phyllotreta striolata]|uniref:Uncharacterized protein n=1 Tax=Phyllotreta striolata TaxID=444603 RepID=A0A9N9TWL9_PHYSR|nr:unnamed protein product [Phyllotreta striolata]